MLYFPFIYFSIFTFVLWKKHKALDISVYITALYAFTSFCSILLVKLNLLDSAGVLFDEISLELNIVPTLLYCILLTITIIPFCRLQHINLQQITIANKHWFDIFTICFLCVALYSFYTIIESVISILQGDISQFATIYTDSHDDVIAEKSSIFAYLLIFTKTTIFALPMFFYSMCFLKKPAWYNLLLLCISLSGPLAAIVAADRTTFVFYAQMFLFCILLFRSFLTPKTKFWLRNLTILLVVSFGLYLGLVSISRWDNSNNTAAEGALQYAGQSYLNFCYFYEYANPNVQYTDRILPTYNYIVNESNYNNTREDRIDQHGFATTVFPSFVGVILLDIGLFKTILWVLAFCFLCFVLFPRSKTEWTFGDIIFIFSVAIIPIFGVFYYHYYSVYNSVQFWIGMMMFIIFRYKIKTS